MNAEGTKFINLTKNLPSEPFGHPAWSPVGSKIAFTRLATSSLWKLTAPTLPTSPTTRGPRMRRRLALRTGPESPS